MSYFDICRGCIIAVDWLVCIDGQIDGWIDVKYPSQLFNGNSDKNVISYYEVPTEAYFMVFEVNKS